MKKFLLFTIATLLLFTACSKKNNGGGPGIDKVKVAVTPLNAEGHGYTRILSSDQYPKSYLDLDRGAKYRIVVLNLQGATITTQDQIVGQDMELEVPSGNTYDIIIYSNNTETLPAHSNNLSLDGTKQFVYFRQKLAVKEDDRLITLEPILKNVFSRVIVEATSQVGVIKEMKLTAQKMYKHPSINLLDTSKINWGTASSHTVNGNIIDFATKNGTNVIATDLKIGEEVGTFTIERYIAQGHRIFIPIDLRQGIVIGDLEWAPGNLSYRDGDYYFEKYEAAIGDYWMWNNLLPKKYHKKQEWELANEMKTFSSANDPCTKVKGGQWRTPSVKEFQTLYNSSNLAYAASRYDGMLYRPGIEFNIRGGRLFLPEADIMGPNLDVMRTQQGHYWTSTFDKNNNAMELLFGFGVRNPKVDQLWMKFNSDYKPRGMNIRCVKNK